MNYLAAGVYWDAGAELAGSTTPSYTLPDGITYHTGLWLKKGANTGSATGITTNPLPVTAAIRNGGEYFFLPANGIYYSYNQYNTSLSGNSTNGCYWLSTKNNATNAWDLRFTANDAGLVPDLCDDAQGIWKVQ
jgi:hypothetical protein